MKTLKLCLATMLSLLFLSCNDTTAAPELELNSDQTKEMMLLNTEFTTDKSSITQSEIDGLLLMREEEKLAGDVYAYFYEAHGLRSFYNINKSEVQHSNAVLRLLNYFGIPDPSLSAVGKFSNTDIQKLYDKLTSDGTTAENALAVGAFIEEYDITDLRELIEKTQNADIITVYTNLLNGSYNHIKAFTRVLASRGITYEPKIISVEELNNITN